MSNEVTLTLIKEEGSIKVMGNKAVQDLSEDELKQFNEMLKRVRLYDHAQKMIGAQLLLHGRFELIWKEPNIDQSDSHGYGSIVRINPYRYSFASNPNMFIADFYMTKLVGVRTAVEGYDDKKEISIPLVFDWEHYRGAHQGTLSYSHGYGRGHCKKYIIKPNGHVNLESLMTAIMNGLANDINKLVSNVAYERAEEARKAKAAQLKAAGFGRRDYSYRFEVHSAPGGFKMDIKTNQVALIQALAQLTPTEVQANISLVIPDVETAMAIKELVRVNDPKLFADTFVQE